jgi:triacylglycerol lipase
MASLGAGGGRSQELIRKAAEAIRVLPVKASELGSKIPELRARVPEITNKIPELRGKLQIPIPSEVVVPYINSMKAKLDPTPLPEVIAPTRYPLVMCHGIGGDKPLLPYWYQIKDDLEGLGVRCLLPKVPRYATVYDRSKVLEEKIKEYISVTGAEKVNLIGHSMGGLDSRHFITRMGGHRVVASLTTIGTPHRGSEWAELLVGHLCDRLKMDKVFSKLVGLDIGAYECVRPGFLEEVFNPQTPNHPSVAYFSFAGEKKEMASMHPLYLPWRHVQKVEGPNDGLVSVRSATWGNLVEVLDCDHAEQINWCFSYDARRLYRTVVNLLRKEGF